MVMRKAGFLTSALIAALGLSFPAGAQTGEPPVIIDPAVPEICFSEGSATLDHTAQTRINEAIETHQWLMAYRVERLIVVAFADLNSQPSQAEDLAKRRAYAIADALVLQGIPAEKVAVDWKAYNYPEDERRSVKPRTCNLAAFIEFG